MIVFDFDFNGFVTKTIDFEQKLNRSSRAFSLVNHTDRENRLVNAFHTFRFAEGLSRVRALNLVH